MSKEFYCQVCDIVCTGKAPFDQHLVSVKHLRKAKTSPTENRPDSPLVTPTSPTVPNESSPSISAETMRALLEWNHPRGYLPYCDICHLPLHGAKENADLHFSPDNHVHREKVRVAEQIQQNSSSFSCKLCYEIFANQEAMMDHFHTDIHATTIQQKRQLEKYVIVFQTYAKLKQARQEQIKADNSLESQFRRLQVIDASSMSDETTTNATATNRPPFNLPMLQKIIHQTLDDE